MTEPDQTIYLLRKFIFNSCTLEELREVERLLVTGIDDTIWIKVLAEHEKTIEGIEFSASPGAEERLKRILNHISSSDFTTKNKQIFFQPWIRWTSVAASILIGILFFPQLKSVFTAEGRTISYRQSATIERQRKKINTYDGSEIWINNFSSLRYPDKFGNKKREVFLEGEGFFQVKKDISRPFIVHTGNVNVKVLGTSFNIQSYKEDEEITVTLESGKIEIEFIPDSKIDGNEMTHQTVILLPGQQIAYNKFSNQYKITETDVYASYAWKDGVLMFSKQPLYKIAQVLERSYGVAIKFEEEQLKAEKITFKQKDENIKNILEVLSYSAGFTYDVNGKNIILSKIK